MAKIIIKENNVLAVETRPHLFVIAQALKNKTLVFFNIFTQTPLSLSLELKNAAVLCCVAPVKNFYANTPMLKLNAAPVMELEQLGRQDHLAFELTNSGRQAVTVYQDTDDEMIIPAVPMGDLRLVNWQLLTLQHLSKEKDQALIAAHQLETMGVYGELNERLYLSYRFGKYVEPMKDLLMGKVHPAYKVYYQIIAQQITAAEWQKLPIEDVLY